MYRDCVCNPDLPDGRINGGKGVPCDFCQLQTEITDMIEDLLWLQEELEMQLSTSDESVVQDAIALFARLKEAI